MCLFWIHPFQLPTQLKDILLQQLSILSYPWHVHVYVVLFCEIMRQIAVLVYIPHMLYVIYSSLFCSYIQEVFQIILTSHLYTKLGNFTFPPVLQPSENHLFILFYFFGQCIIANFFHERMYFYPCNLRFCFIKPGPAHISEEVIPQGPRLNLDFSVADSVKLLFRMILPSLARRLVKGTAGGLTQRQDLLVQTGGAIGETTACIPLI